MRTHLTTQHRLGSSPPARVTSAWILAVGLLTAATVVAVAATPAMAQEKGKKKKEKTYNFEDDMIETQYLRPDTAVTDGLKNNKRASLIRIRTNFFAELIRSAEDL